MTDKKTEALKLALELALDVRANSDARLVAKAIALTNVIDAALAREAPEKPALDEDQAHYKQVIEGVQALFEAKREEAAEAARNKRAELFSHDYGRAA